MSSFVEDRKRLFCTPRPSDMPPFSRGTNETFSYASSSSSVPQKECQHGRVKCYISYADENPGRRFLRCYYRRFDDCDYLEWVDPETPKHLRKLLVKLMDNKQDMEGEMTELRQSERDLVYKAEASSAVVRASKDIVSTMCMQIRKAEKMNEELQRAKGELVEMNMVLDKKVDNLTNERAKLVVENKKLRLKVKQLRKVCWLLGIMLGGFVAFAAAMKSF
ncbi:uncharacterized protein LOC126657681 [Mercurialis annua]|uniref:uncharacterized protein LOC126657681 n=1 Tax=Mercurialis annua TaxID=3986 RepID=UPI002160DC19|nr:uncharacterized protein LOC126657681 [Mercurialis annua]